MKTYSLKAAEAPNKWYVIDASDLILGRLACIIANRLRGKHLPTFTPHVAGGDNIIVVNAEKVALTGTKLKNKKFYWHTGFPGGIKEKTMGQILDGRFPERAIVKAVERMISRGPLGRQLMTRLKVYKGAEHPHAAQNPEVLNIAEMNAKNKRTR